MTTNTTSPVDAWAQAARLLMRALEEGERVDALLDSMPSAGRTVRARVQHLLFGAIRHRGRIEAHLEKLIERTPRSRVQAALLLAGYELIEAGADDGQTARIGHHAVEQVKSLASESEARLVNAVVRKLAVALHAENAPGRLANAERLADYYSHPEWLVSRWLAQYGASETRLLLEWNQRPAPVYARWRQLPGCPGEAEAAFLHATPWSGFYEVVPGNWEAVEAAIADGRLFLQDPATRHAVELLGLKGGETVLDLCAAPGGKSLAIADVLAMNGGGAVVAVDLPGDRQSRLRENLGRARTNVTMHLVETDLRNLGDVLHSGGKLPMEYACVLLDAPCSNTGVMRHRVDVKWRLQPADLLKHSRQQVSFLLSAAARVVPGGRLVYSTCSIDFEENEAVVETFIKKAGDRFRLEETRLSRPWLHEHDGAAAFLLRRA